MVLEVTCDVPWSHDSGEYSSSQMCVTEIDICEQEKYGIIQKAV